MRIALALYESGDKGKTTTLNLLIDLIISEITGLSVEEKTMDELRKDQRICFEFRGHKVGICTWGDNETELRKNCEFFDQEKCTFIITATRSKGATCKVINDYCMKNGFALQWINKTVAIENLYQVNLEQAYELMKYI